MSFGDDWLKNGLPTYQGSKDRPLARGMIDGMGGPEGFKKAYRTNPDGSVTMVHTRGEMPPEVITTEVGTTQRIVSMDSGTIDMVGIAPMDPLRFDDGILHYGVNQLGAYAAEKLLGQIKPPGITNPRPPADLSLAKSFSVVPSSYGIRSSEDQTMLWLKKVCLGQVPPSLFCGKARLYAQAQYGADMVSWAWAPVIGGTPSLQSFSGTQLTTNSGIYTDETYHHWLINLEGASLKVTRLKAAPKVEPLRRLLAIAGVDHDRIETYILAYSSPDEAISFSIPIPGLPADYMFGYGWHFNWDGTEADKIVTESYETGVGFSVENRSTHYRVSVTRAAGTGGTVAQEQARWSATMITVEGPVVWKNDKWAQVIASPAWGESQLEIFGSLWGDRFGDAPIYCFYKRNTLEVVRFLYTGGVGGTMRKIVSSPTGWMGVCDWTVDVIAAAVWYRSLGLQDATGELRLRTETPITAGFSGGSVSAITTCESYDYWRETLTGKTYEGTSAVYSYVTGVINIEFNPNDYVAYTEPLSITSDGVQRYGGGVTQPAGYFSAPCFNYTISSQIVMSYSRGSYAGRHNEMAEVVLVIPFYDAEAVYYWGEKTTSESDVSSVVSCSSGLAAGSAFVTEYNWYDYGGALLGTKVVYTGQDTTYLPAGGAPASGTTSTSSSAIVASSLETNPNVVPFNPPHSMGMFFAGEPTLLVPQTFTTYTSCEGAIFGHGAENAMGFTFKISPFIGWA